MQINVVWHPRRTEPKFFHHNVKSAKCVLVPNYAWIYADVWCIERTAECMFLLCFRQTRTIYFSSRRLYAREKNPSVYLTGEWTGQRVLLAWWKKISSALCNCKTNSPPSEATIFTPNQDILHISRNWDTNSQYRVHNDLATVSVLSQLNPVQPS